MVKDIFDKSVFDGDRVESLTESVQDIIRIIKLEKFLMTV